MKIKEIQRLTKLALDENSIEANERNLFVGQKCFEMALTRVRILLMNRKWENGGLNYPFIFDVAGIEPDEENHENCIEKEFGDLRKKKVINLLIKDLSDTIEFTDDE